MAPITADQLTELQLFLKRYDGIDLYTPASPDYEEYRESFVIRPARPFAIARPSTAGDVQALIRFCLRHEVDFNIRSGGHDSAGRSQINNGLSIDMRKLNYVDVAEDKSVAKIGGGILLGQLTKLLGDEDLVTPTYALYNRRRERANSVFPGEQSPRLVTLAGRPSGDTALFPLCTDWAWIK
jgi:FAD/FMN-containing dehydrogenase